MKNVVIIWSSPNTDGLTASAKNQFTNDLIDAGKTYSDRLENGFDMYY